MTDTILVAANSVYDASILVVVREVLYAGLNDNPESVAVVNSMPHLFMAITAGAAQLWRESNAEMGYDETGHDEEYKKETSRIVDCLRQTLAHFEEIQNAKSGAASE